MTTHAPNPETAPAPPTQREIDAWQAIAQHREGNRISVCTACDHLDLIVTSVHAGESPDIRAAYLTGRAIAVPVQVTVAASQIAAGFYWLLPAKGASQ